MQTRVGDELPNSDGPMFAKLMTMAERELGAFISAVTELFSSEQAKLAAVDWLDELVLMEAPCGCVANASRRSARLARA
jgi:hypothetical protein